MMRILLIKLITCSILLLNLFNTMAIAAKTSIIAFDTGTTHFINGNGVTVCDLSDYHDTLAQRNQQLKMNHVIDPQQLSEQYQHEFKKISNSYLCQYQAKILGISKLPAIVFNQKYVVYGQTDVLIALQQYRQYVKEGDCDD